MSEEQKRKNERNMMIAVFLVCLIPIIAGIIVYDKLPNPMPIHWGFDGEVNGYGSKFFALFVLPGIMGIVAVFMPLLLKLDPKNENMSPALKKVMIWLLPGISIFCSGAMISAAMGIDVAFEVIVPLIVGAVLILIGNYLPKTKQSYTMGIKLPWTLDSEENWNKTHRMAGPLWVACGIVLILSMVLGIFSFALLAADVIIAVLVPTVYSYMYYRKYEKDV